MSDFLEITCKSSGKVRRFSVGTEASFALQLINQKLDSVDPSALYIEAIKQGEEPISFGPNSVLIDYGDGWKLQTVTRQGSHRQKAMEEFPTAIKPASGDVHSATDVHLDLLEPPLQDESRPITSEPVSDVESQSLEKLDFTDTFKTDVTRKQVFNSRDELIRWARDLGKSIGMVREQVANNESPPQQQQTILQLPHQFLEIYCKCSGKVRRFSVGTEASFALQLINKKLGHGVPSALYIEAIKEGEEPITFGPNSVLIDYGDGWKLETVTNEGSEIQNEYDYKELPDIIEPARDDVQSATDLEFHLTDLPLQDENMPVTSEPISDIESQSLRKLDFTDAFTTDVVFNCRDELVTWARDVGRSVGMVVIIKKSEFGASGRSSRIFLACERFGKRREYKVPFKKKTSATRRRVSKRCDCPFLLRGIKMPKDDQWRVKVECGYHNHPLERHLQGSSVAGKLTPEEKDIVIQLLRQGVKAKEILKVLKERDERNESTVRTIYNAQAKLRHEEMSATSQMGYEEMATTSQLGYEEMDAVSHLRHEEMSAVSQCNSS
ncbi:hypothetical protein IFM89_038729 [Coptis chinensis]|uniref:Uncharacterized protein n=1 Tax=Coptis chinensis TaxID=261450 RepID=A0A835HJJ5_9MAGN|nr:hypothetical protein IFM89_038729 [Coptis chinensis]